MMVEMMNTMKKGFKNRSTADKSSSYDSEDDNEESEGSGEVPKNR
jgi:hypothetical protein